MRHLEDFQVGDVFELGSRSVSAAEIVEFATQFDPQPRHLGGDQDDDLIASGWHIAAILMRLYVDAVLRDSAVEVSPGVDELRWLRPVRPGDVLTGRITVLGVTPSLSRPDCGILRSRAELTTAGALPILHATLYGLMRKG
ncbi:MaoC/PaaZ C-terminal domain-containing protein [Actinophytocola sediminis]